MHDHRRGCILIQTLISLEPFHGSHYFLLLPLCLSIKLSLLILGRPQMATTTAPLRTPSPKVRIRSQSFDSPSSRTPIDQSPFSKPIDSIATNPFHSRKGAKHSGEISSVGALLTLHTRMSNLSILSTLSSTASSTASSPPESESHMELCTNLSLVPNDDRPVNPQASPFLYQDTRYAMYAPWLVKVVLNLCDVRGLDWMSISEPVERIWGVRTCAAEVLAILSSNGRVAARRWWD